MSIRFSLSPFSSHIFLWLIMGIILSSCNITKNVPEGKYLLDKTKLEIDNTKQKVIKSGDLESYVRQKPNKRILLFRFHLRVYNSANPDKNSGIHKWLKTIGEEPVILDTQQTAHSTRNLKQYLQNKGFYGSKVTDTTLYKNSKAITKYKITLGQSKKISSIKYVIEDTVIRGVLNRDINNSLIKPGVRLDKDILNEERIRIENVLKEQGYFFFSRDFITFSADTTVGKNRVDLILNIRNRFMRNQFGDRIVQEYKKYQINDVFVFPNYDPINFHKLKEAGLLDTVFLNNLHFIFSDYPGVNLPVLDKANLIKPGEVYSESNVTKTRNNFSALRLFRMVNIYFETVDNGTQADGEQPNDFLFFNEQTMSQKTHYGKLNCYIQLATHTIQSYQVDLVGTNSSSDFGAEANFNYQHKNLFKGAEIFDTKFRSMFEFIQQTNRYQPAIEVGGAVSLNFPRFLSPFSGKEYITKFSPRTLVSASYNYQDRPEYRRAVAGMNFGYSWKNAENVTHSIVPIEINLINIVKMDPGFYDDIVGKYIFYSYQDQLVTQTSYTYLFNNQVVKKNINYSLFRYNIEFSGNILNGIYSAVNGKEPGKAYQLFGIDFSQYIRSEVSYTFNHVVDKNNTFVYRFFGGLGYPYGNSRAMPFEKKFFGGGSSGIRAWHARRLGPGTYLSPESDFYNETADIKLEANIEYRFKLIWMLEGALFVDAGNIWAITSDDERPGALFKPNTFYKQIALGTGMGIRMNLGFFIVRLDVGAKIHDPAIKLPVENELGEIEEVDNYHWIPFDRSFNRNDFVFQFGIGYPF